MANQLPETNDFSLKHRTYVEMRLCPVWLYINHPPGYYAETGKVMVDEEVSGESDLIVPDHIFILNRHDYIYCLSPGQFVKTDETAKPGQRIAFLQRRAPHLFIEKNGLTFLHGHRFEIAQKLGLSYLTNMDY